MRYIPIIEIVGNTLSRYEYLIFPTYLFWKVTDPKLSQALYDESRSFDKHIKLYEGMSHTITSGEPEKNLDIVFNDIITWIEARL